MGPIAVAKTDIDRDRHIVLQGFSQDIIQSHHKLRRPGKGIRRGIPEFYNDKITLRCHPRIASAGCPAIACRNAGHMCRVLLARLKIPINLYFLFISILIFFSYFNVLNKIIYDLMGKYRIVRIFIDNLSYIIFIIYFSLKLFNFF